MAIIQKDIKKIVDVLSKDITIPPYQRPYKWDERLVGQLLDDLQVHQAKDAYRLGTVVFFKDPDENQLQVVDGQQRLITLCLLMHIIGPSGKLPLLNQSLPHRISQNNIKRNYTRIEQIISNLSKDERFSFRQFLINKCELVTVELNDLSEAFQFFDSQNARGKELEPHDLLKAYHLREMGDISESERMDHVTRWEKEVETGRLKTVVNDYLYRIRQWLKGQQGREFLKSEVNVFKGITLKNSVPYPYLQSYRINDHFTNAYASDPIRIIDHQHAGYPFQIDQLMINGKRFFEYIHHYIALQNKLSNNPPEELKEMYSVLNSYAEGRHRDGDGYTRNLFDCVLLYYFDKFGTFDLARAANIAFAWCYAIRLTQHTVQLATMDNKAREENNLLSAIQKAVHPREISGMVLPRLEQNQLKGTKIDLLKDKMKSLRFL